MPGKRVNGDFRAISGRAGQRPAGPVLPRSEMGGVAPLLIPGLNMTRSAGILYRSSAGITPAMRALIEAIKTLAHQLGAN